MPHAFQDDIDAVAAIPAVGDILEVICRTTGMRFAAVARVTDDRWVCCASRDDLELGLVAGSELWIETTICNEIRGHGNVVAIDDVRQSATFCDHPTPKIYGFNSYLSVPIRLEDGGFWGTLCSVDPHPNTLNNQSVIGMFQLFARLLGHELDTQKRLAAMAAENAALQDRFRNGLGHDMKNTLATMEAGARLLAKTPLNDRGQMIVREMESSARALSQQIDDAMKPLTRLD